MSKYELLWTQRAYAKANTIRHFGNFIYEFVGARFTLIAFIGLFNFAAIGLSFFDEILTFGIVLFLYYLISDAFNVFWTGVNLEYHITKQGIVYNWGVFRSHELLVPFEEIVKISAIRGNSNKRNALVFENSLKIKNGDYGFSKELFFNALTFENIQNLETVIKILEKEGGYDIDIKEKHQSNTLDEKLTSSYLYLKFLQLLTLVFLYLTTNIALHLLDSNLLSNTYVKDIVVAQENRPYGPKYFYNHLKTEKGHSFVLKGRYFYDHMDEEIELLISPIFKNVIGFENYKQHRYESLKNGYLGGINILFKLAALLISFMSGSYIFYKRSYIPFEDLTVFLIFPMGILIVAFFIFH